MAFSISHQTGIPIYVQLQNQIKDLVRRGIWEQGVQLPTERDLAEQMNISRNTVSMAYKQLESEGIVRRRQGSGTFICVSADELAVGAASKTQVLKLVDLAIGEAIQLGFSIEDFTAIVSLRVRQRKEMLSRLQVAFIECNREQLDYFAHELELGSGIAIHPILLEDFQRRSAKNLRDLQQMDLVVTTFYHLDEIKDAFGSQAPPLLGIALEPVVSSIVQIARIASDQRIPVVSISKTFAESIVNVLEQAGLVFADMPLITTRNPAELLQAIAEAPVVISSPGRKKDVKQAVDRNTKIIEFVFRPDASSIRTLQATLLGIRNKSSDRVGV